MSISEAERKLNDIFFKRLNIDFSKKSKKKDSNLLGDEVGISPYELIYVFFDIERDFNVIFKESEITQENFFSFNSLLNLLCEKIK